MISPTIMAIKSKKVLFSLVVTFVDASTSGGKSKRKGREPLGSDSSIKAEQVKSGVVP